MNRGVTDVDEMSRHLREFVRIEIFPGREVPPPTSRQYFPTKKDIYNHMYRVMVKSRFQIAIKKMQRKQSRSGKRKPPMTNFSSVNIVTFVMQNLRMMLKQFQQRRGPG